MIEYPIQHHLDTIFMEAFAHSGKIFIGSESRIDFGVISCIVAVSVRFKNRRKIYRICTKTFDMLNPIKNLKYPAFSDTVVSNGAPQKPSGYI